MRAIFERGIAAFIIMLLAVLWAPSGMITGAVAHPMPDSEIIVVRWPDRVDLTIYVPMDDLLLAMKDDKAAAGIPRDADTLLAKRQINDQAAFKAYVASHVKLVTADGKAVPLTIDRLLKVADSDADVGDYAELEVHAYGDVAGDIPLTLVYDLVLGRIANHRALVHDEDGEEIGVIRYNLADKKAEALVLPAAKELIASAPKQGAVLQSITAFEDRINLINRIVWLSAFTVLALIIAIGLWVWRRRGR